MKLFKLVKSIDHVTYPAYREIKRLSDSLDDSLSQVRDILWSTVISIILKIQPISDIIVDLLVSKIPEKDTILSKIFAWKHIGACITCILFISIYYILRTFRSIRSFFSSNKNTQKKRDVLVEEFYHIIVPEIIEAKSLLEKIKEEPNIDKRKRVHFLSQAHYEVRNVMLALERIKIAERGKKGTLKKGSLELIDAIGKHSLSSYLEELLDILLSIFDEYTEYCKDAIDEIKDIGGYITVSGIFNSVSEIELENMEKAAKSHVSKYYNDNSIQI